jgi:D-aminopeptidase
MPSRFLLTPVLLAMTVVSSSASAQRARARDLGVKPGVFPPGRLNAITDVAGVRVGHTTVIEGDSVRTGVTAILPHAGNLFSDRVPAALHVGNGFGKITGVTQLRELGELETPILLTCTLCVWRAADAMVGWLLEQPGMSNVKSINPVVAETNDGTLNNIRSRPIKPEHVRAALTSASNGPVAEGAVGAGTGTVAFGGRVVSAPHRACCPQRSVVGRSAYSCRRISAGFSRCSALRWGRSLGSTRSSAKRSRRAIAVMDHA